VTVRGAACAYLLAVLSAASSVRAQGDAAGDAVALDADACAGLDVEALRELVALELSPRPVVLAADTAEVPAGTRARLACGPERASLEVRDRQRAEPLTLELDLGRTPPAARTRLVALTLSELIVTSRMEQSAAAQASPPPEPGAAVEDGDEAEAEAPQPPRASLWLAAAAVHEGSPGGLAFGPQLGVLADLGPLSLHAAVQADWRSDRIAGADVSARALALSLSPGLAFQLGALTSFVGAGVQLGHVRLEAAAPTPGVEGRTLSGLWHAPALVVAGQLAVAGPLALHLGLDLAYVTRPVRGLDQRQSPGSELYAHEGLRFGAALGLAVAL